MLGNLYQTKHWVLLYSGRFVDWYTGLDAQTLPPRKHLFSVAFQQKFVEVAITNFTMHLIISKWLRMQ